MKKITISLMALILGLVLVAPALADNTTTTATSTPTVKPYKAREVVVTGNVTAISNYDLTVKVTRIVPTQIKNYPGTYPTKDSLVVIKVGDKTNLVRKYSGKADFSEFAVGDAVSVNGVLEADGTITPRLLRDNSVHATFYARKGEVTSIDTAAGTFMIKNGDKTYTVFVTTNTKFYKAGKLLTGLSNLGVGDVAAVRGVVRQSANEINADTVVITTDKSAVEEQQQKIKDQKRARLEKQLANLQSQMQKIKDEIEKLK